MSSTTAEATIEALRPVFYTQKVVSDNGPQFVAQELKTFSRATTPGTFLVHNTTPPLTGRPKEP